MDKVYLLTLGGFTGIFEEQETAKVAAKSLAVETGKRFKARIMEIPINKGEPALGKIVTLIAKTKNVREAANV